MLVWGINPKPLTQIHFDPKDLPSINTNPVYLIPPLIEGENVLDI